MASRWRISSEITSKSSFWDGDMARERFKEKSRMFTEVKGLRMLWATPAASFPTMAHLPDCSRCSWLFSSSLWVWSTFSMRL